MFTWDENYNLWSYMVIISTIHWAICCDWFNAENCHTAKEWGILKKITRNRSQGKIKHVLYEALCKFPSRMRDQDKRHFSSCLFSLILEQSALFVNSQHFLTLQGGQKKELRCLRNGDALGRKFKCQPPRWWYENNHKLNHWSFAATGLSSYSKPAPWGRAPLSA